MSDPDHCANGVIPHAQKQQMQPWHRLSAIRDVATQIELQQAEWAEIYAALHNRDLDPDNADDREQLRRYDIHQSTFIQLQDRLESLLGGLPRKALLSLAVGDRTIGIFRGDFYIEVRTIIGVADYIEGAADEA